MTPVWTATRRIKLKNNRKVHPSRGKGNKTENKQPQTTRKPARKERTF